MKIELTVDGKYLALSVSSDKPLNLLLRDDLEIKSIHSHCNGRMCGNCIVLVDGRPVLSCLVPSFSVRGMSLASRTRKLCLTIGRVTPMMSVSWKAFFPISELGT